MSRHPEVKGLRMILSTRIWVASGSNAVGRTVGSTVGRRVDRTVGRTVGRTIASADTGRKLQIDKRTIHFGGQWW